MGLAVEVGFLADALVHDPEAAEWAVSDLEAINGALADKGFGAHDEPRDCAVWSAEFVGYSGLHALREVAGIVHAGQDVPRDRVLDGNQTEFGDALAKTFYEHLSGKGNLTLLGRALRSFFKAKEKAKMPPFVHLVVHSDCDGFYVPVEFELPLVPRRSSDENEHLWPLGSVFRLEKDVNALAEVLELPVELASTHEDVQRYLETPNNAGDAPLWQAQPVAAQACLVLREACHQSLITGAAIHFC